MDINIDELETLLNNYWIVKDDNPEVYIRIKNSLDSYKNFIQDKLGSKLIVNSRFIKLEKIPALPKSYMAIEQLDSKLEYVLLLMILLFLEDKPNNEQFILSDLVEFITNTAHTLKINNLPDWNLFSHRKSLKDVIEFLESRSVIRIVEEINNFSENRNAEGLYESTGISNFFIREFKGDISKYTSLDDYVNDEFISQDTNTGDIRRFKVYRHLLYSLCAYEEDLTTSEMDYLKKFRGSIKSEISKYTLSSLELTKHMALLLYDDDTKERYDFPNAKTISDFVLMVNSYVLNEVEKGLLKLEEDETILVSKEELSRIIKEVRNSNLNYLSKAHRDMVINSFVDEVITFMIYYDFIRKYDSMYKIYPMVSKLTGHIEVEEEREFSQLEMEEISNGQF